MGTIFEVDWRTGIAVDRSLYGFVALVLERLFGLMDLSETLSFLFSPSCRVGQSCLES